MKNPYSKYSERSNLTHVYYDMNGEPLNIGDKVEVKQHIKNGNYAEPIQGELQQISVFGVSLILPDGNSKWIAFDWTASESNRVYTMTGKEEQDGRYPWDHKGYIKLIS